jgi:diguanylate cyclase (GGDEF)-like protein
MTLIQRLRLILLPIILLVFSVTGTLVYKAVYDRHVESEFQRLSTLLDFFYKEYQLELTSAQSALDLVLSSNELIDYLNQAENSYSAHTLNIMLNNQLRLLQQRLPGTRSIQIVDFNNDIVISAGEEDPFADPTWPHFPPSVLDRNRDYTGNYTLPLEQHILYSDSPNHLSLGVIRRFSSELILLDKIATNSSTYRAIYDSSALSYQHLVDALNKDFDFGYAITLKPVLQGGELIQHTFGAFQLGDDLFVRKVNDLFTLELTVDESNIGNALNDLRWQLIVLILCLTFGCYIAIWQGIRHQMIAPIRHLVSILQQSTGAPKLEKLTGNSEVAKLNNAYVDLVDRVQYISSYDRLTELGNRQSFDACLEDEIIRANAQQSLVAVLHIDLDNFKKVNDHFGHQLGDQLLTEFSKRLLALLETSCAIAPLKQLRVVDYVARLAGDEFGVILNNVTHEEDAEKIAQEINQHFSEGFKLDGKILDIQVSIGLALYPDVAKTRQELVVYSDEAKHQAKRRGKNQVQIFTKEIADNLELRKFIESELVKCFHHDGFELVYQPLFDSQSMEVACYEVLLRCPSLAIHGIGPDKFIPIAEATGLIRLIDLWVIENAFNTHKKLIEHGYKGKAAINISAIELNNPNFPHELEKLLTQYDVNPHTIELEITETSLVDSGEKTESILWSIKRTGVNLALDDFGTGYTGLSQLAKYPIDTLKIDRSFISNLSPDSQNQQSMFNVIVQLAAIYGLETVAEGVETKEECAATSAKCTYLQGYYLSRPISYQHLVEKIESYVEVVTQEVTN